MKYRSNLKFFTGVATERVLLGSLVVRLVNPGAPGGSAVINDNAPSTASVYSSAKTEQVIDDAVTEQIYDYDLLVSSNLSI